ncbi:MAG: LysR family transcriptional regulator [Candidatus Cryptobacteroides sp.]
MELRQLRYFVEVAQSLSFSEASRKLYITQGTISQQIRQLEDELGSQLFDRTSQKIVLTEAGIEMLPMASKIIEDSEICKEKVRNLRNTAAGTLNVGATKSFCKIVNSTMYSFMRELPEVKLTVSYKTASELLYMIRRNEIDMSVAFRPDVEYEDIVTYPLFKTFLCAVMRKDHPLADRVRVTLSDLKDFGIVIPGRGSSQGCHFGRFAGIDTRRLNVRAEINDPHLLVDLAQASNLVAIITPVSSWDRPGMVAIPLEGGKYPMTGSVHFLKDRHRKKSAELFMSKLMDEAAICRFERNLQKQ